MPCGTLQQQAENSKTLEQRRKYRVNDAVRGRSEREPAGLAEAWQYWNGSIEIGAMAHPTVFLQEQVCAALRAALDHNDQASAFRKLPLQGIGENFDSAID